MSADLIVIGAGPAGATAAVAAASRGMKVILMDEAADAGGQVYRAPAAGSFAVDADRDADRRAGDDLRRLLAHSSVIWMPGRRVWSVATGFRVDATGPDGPEIFTAPRLIAATGAHERVVPFPGWTLPGVIGLAAATILIKSQGMLPGPRVVIAGCGPLLAAVAGKTAAAGGKIAAVCDLSGPSDWLAATPGMLRRPKLLARGLGWVLKLGSHRVPIYFRHTVVGAQGIDQIKTVTLAPVDATGATIAGPRRVIETDTLVVGHGLVPGSEIPRLLRAPMTFVRERGGWVPVVDRFGRTDISGLYAIGDGAGIRGAEPAALAGRIAGMTVALDAGKLDKCMHDTAIALLARQLSAYVPFADAVSALMALRPAQVASIASETIVCRCEDVTRSEIDQAVRDGAHEVNQLKQFSRCGMGPCQGRMCGDVAAEILAQSRDITREEAGCWTMRPPLRPVPIDEIVGRFDYSDIPIPQPAPL